MSQQGYVHVWVIHCMGTSLKSKHMHSIAWSAHVTKRAQQPEYRRNRQYRRNSNYRRTGQMWPGTLYSADQGQKPPGANRQKHHDRCGSQGVLAGTKSRTVAAGV